MRQPWLQDATPARGDDFSPASVTRPAGVVARALALALLLLAMGRSPQMLDAAYGLEPGLLADRLLAAAEVWDGAMRGLGVPEALARLRPRED